MDRDRSSRRPGGAAAWRARSVTCGAERALLADPAVGLPADAALLIHALQDSHNVVRWTDGTQFELPANRMLYVVAAGVRSVEELPALPQRIDFMTFIAPPR